MKSSIATVMLLVAMTSYSCEGCYFTNCPNKWEWGKVRSTRSTDDQKSYQEYQLLDNILQKMFNEVSVIRLINFIRY